jgi:hypothetical protein
LFNSSALSAIVNNHIVIFSSCFSTFKHPNCLIVLQDALPPPIHFLAHSIHTSLTDCLFSLRVIYPNSTKLHTFKPKYASNSCSKATYLQTKIRFKFLQQSHVPSNQNTFRPKYLPNSCSKTPYLQTKVRFES